MTTPRISLAKATAGNGGRDLATRLNRMFMSHVSAFVNTKA